MAQGCRPPRLNATDGYLNPTPDLRPAISSCKVEDGELVQTPCLSVVRWVYSSGPPTRPQGSERGFHNVLRVTICVDAPSGRVISSERY